MTQVRKKKKTLYNTLKLLTTYMTQPQTREKLKSVLLNDPQLPQILQKRIWWYFAKKPNVMSWVNDYLNWYLDARPEDILYTVTFIYDNAVKDSNALHFARQDFIELNGITSEYKQNMLNDPIEYRGERDIQCIQFLTRYLASDNSQVSIFELVAHLEKRLDSSGYCNSCPMYGRPRVILDTNLEQLAPVKIAFVGLNPGKQEVEQGKPFVGDAGKYIREIIAQLNVPWLITNVIWCGSANRTEIPEFDTTLQHCIKNTQALLDMFSPEIIVLVGADAARAFGFTQSIKTLHGKKQGRYFFLVHPSFILRQRSDENIRLWNEGVDNLLYALGIKKHELRNEITWEDVETQKLTFFDLYIDGEIAIWIFIDADGNRYFIKDTNITLPVYVKTGNLTRLGLIESEFDDMFEVPLENYQEFTSLLRRSLEKTTGKI